MTRSGIAVVVVVYLPADDVLPRLQGYTDFAARVVVVDNSEPPIGAAAMDAHPRLDYIALGTNAGVAAALNVGVRRAVEAGHRTVVLLDQDSVLTSDALASAIAAATGEAIVGLREWPRDDPLPAPPQVAATTRVDVNITSGSILDVDAFLRCGPFDERLFIDYVDHDFCLRLRRAGYTIARCDDAYLGHALGEPLTVSVLGREWKLVTHRPFRLYYMVRNGLYVVATYGRERPRVALHVLLVLGKELVKALLFEEDRLPRLRHLAAGARDWLVGRYGSLALRP